jgi:anti-sigma B factor antagonist
LDGNQLSANPIDGGFEKIRIDHPYRTSRTSAGETILVATGRLDFYTAKALRRQLHGHIAAGETHLVVDLSGVTSMDSSGVGALIFGLKSARSVGGDLRLVAPTESVAGILGMMNLTELLVTCESTEDAFPASRRHE